MKPRIYLSPPYMSSTEKEMLIDAFDSNWIAPLGPNVDAFEHEMSQYIGVENATALSSGTAALHLALIILGIKPGDRVLCSSLTFSASANAIRYVGAEPVFIDSDLDTWTINSDLVETAIKRYHPQALIPVDLYGQSCNYNRLIDLCNRYNVFLIEDAAEALGGEYQGKKCGSFGEMGILSFNGNKIITTSGGGMLLSNNPVYIKNARFLATQAREPAIHYEHKELGYNYRMSNLLAAVGRGQLRVIDDRVASRRKIFDRYVEELGYMEGVEFMPEAGYGKSNRWLTTLTIDPTKTGVDRTQIIQALEKENIEARPVWKPMHLQPLYHGCEFVSKDGEDISGQLFANGLCLPSGSSLSETDQDRVIDIVSKTLKS